MIGKIQRLKNKKGFTIVELLIVIAIIGVLAAILIPLMGDYLTKARVTSANASASAYKTQINSFLTDRAMDGNGRNETSTVAAFTIKVGSNGKHDISAYTTSPFSSDTTNWNGTLDDILDDLEEQLDRNITDVKSASIIFSLRYNTCVSVVINPNTDSASNLQTFINSSDGMVKGITDGLADSGGAVLGSK